MHLVLKLMASCCSMKGPARSGDTSQPGHNSQLRELGLLGS